MTAPKLYSICAANPGTSEPVNHRAIPRNTPKSTRSQNDTKSSIVKLLANPKWNAAKSIAWLKTTNQVSVPSDKTPLNTTPRQTSSSNSGANKTSTKICAGKLNSNEELALVADCPTTQGGHCRKGSCPPMKCLTLRHQ